MPSLEQSESVGGAIFLGVPAFDAFVWALDNYARIELLVRLRSHLPPVLLSPVTGFICMCVGLGLLYLSHLRQLQRIIASASDKRRLVDTSGTEILNIEKPQWVLPVCVVFILALVAAPVVAIAYSLAYKGSTPQIPFGPSPPFFAYIKTPTRSENHRPVPTSQSKLHIQQGPGSALSFNQQGGITAGTLNIDTKDEWRLTDDQKKELKKELSAFTGSVEVSFVVEAGSDNANALAQELANVFNLPRWKVIQFDLQTGPIAPGITIESPAEYNPPAAFLQERLQNILGQSIPAILTGQADVPKDKYEFTLFIRRKK